MVYVIRFGHTYQLMMPYCSRFSVPDGCLQSILPPTVEFDSAAAALSIFHTKVLERKSLVIPDQRATSPFPPDSTAACQPTCPTSIVLPLPLAPTAVPSGTSRPIGPIQLQYTVARQESGKDTHVYPTHAELYCRTPQHLSHGYKAEAELPYVIFLWIKLNWPSTFHDPSRLQSDGNFYSKIAAGRLRES